jgi:hypothetical protein
VSPLAGKYGVPVVNLFRSAAFFQRFARYFSQHSLRGHGMSYLLYMHVCSYDPEIRINLHEISALFRFEARV